MDEFKTQIKSEIARFCSYCYQIDEAEIGKMANYKPSLEKPLLEAIAYLITNLDSAEEAKKLIE